MAARDCKIRARRAPAGLDTEGASLAGARLAAPRVGHGQDASGGQAGSAAGRVFPSVAARHHLILQHIGLVHHIANRLARLSGEPSEDLVQEGLVGLIRAVDNYSPSHGTEFSTYAYRFIEGYMLNHLRRRRRDPVTLSALSSEGEEGGGDPDGGFWRQVLDRMTIAQAMDTLSPLEKGVLRRFFYADLTQTEIASVLGRSRGYISRILRRALEKLRVALMEIEAQQAATESDKQPSEPLVDCETGLFSRRHFERCLEAEVARSSVEGSSFCAIMIRVDSGDIKAAGAAVRARIRAVDQAFRFDERRLAVIVPADARQARAVGRRLLLSEMPTASPLRFSWAVAEFPRHGKNAQALIREALRRLNSRAATTSSASDEGPSMESEGAARVR